MLPALFLDEDDLEPDDPALFFAPDEAEERFAVAVERELPVFDEEERPEVERADDAVL